MDTDLLLTLGIVLAVLSIPTLLSAWVEGRVPRLGALFLLTAIVMIIYAVTTRPGGYAFDEIPGIMLAVFSRAIN
jgi:uncharacterized membrane protein